MNFLSVDTATCGISVSVFLNDGRIITKSSDNMRNQVQILLPFVVDTLMQAEISFVDLDALVATVGPGSFTGIRVGLSAMQGIALATNLPLIGFSNFDIYAGCYKFVNDNDLMVVLDSQRKEAFYQIYGRDGYKQGMPFQTDIEDLPQYVSKGRVLNIVGSGYEVLKEIEAEDNFKVQNQSSNYRENEHSLLLGKLLLSKLEDKSLTELQNEYDATPFYIRPPDVTVPNK